MKRLPLGIIALVVFPIMACSLIEIRQAGQVAEAPASTPLPTAIPAPPTATAVPTDIRMPMHTRTPAPAVSPDQQLRMEIEKALGSNNGQRRPLTDFKITAGGAIIIVWQINDNLTEDLVKRGVRMDIAAILKAIACTSAPLDYTAVNLRGRSFADGRLWRGSGNQDRPRGLLSSRH